MKTNIALILLTIFSPQLLADTHGKGHGAHVHGSIKIEMAVEGKMIDIAIDGPAESFVGFEHAAKSNKEKEIFNNAQALWTKSLLTKLFILDSKIGCKSLKATFNREADGETHSDIEAEAQISCEQDLSGKTITIALKKHYPHIKNLEVELVGKETKSISIKNAVQPLVLK